MTFIVKNPSLSEFESQILYFQKLEQEINAEPEYICVGAIALYTGWFIFFQSFMKIQQYCSVSLPRLAFQRVLAFLKIDFPFMGLKLQDQFVDLFLILFCMIIYSELFWDTLVVNFENKG